MQQLRWSKREEEEPPPPKRKKSRMKKGLMQGSCNHCAILTNLPDHPFSDPSSPLHFGYHGPPSPNRHVYRIPYPKTFNAGMAQ